MFENSDKITRNRGKLFILEKEIKVSIEFLHF